MEIMNRRNKIAAGAAIFICILFAAYFMPSIYFMKHLYFGSKIDGKDVSGKTVDQIKSQMASELKTYTLNIKERGDKNEQITADEINLKYKSDEQFKNFKDKQNPLNWFLSFLNKKNTNMTAEVSYDKKLLKQKVENLSCFQDNKVIEPKEPSLKYVNNNFVIVNEVKGNRINKDVLMQSVENAISKKETTIDLDSLNCYVTPKYTSKSEKVVKAKENLNKYVSSKIIYTFGNSRETLDSTKIHTWLKNDDDFNVKLDEGKVEEYVESLAYIYNTVGKMRSFHTSSGNFVNVSDGDYGWQININKETKDLIETIEKGQTITKEPSYNQTAISHGTNDIGNTYVEIDLTKQHLWFYKNGILLTQGDIVTGNLSLNTATPAGIYRLKDKERNYTLKGQDYSTPVSYWMPFNGGIGIHDANWRNEFGKDIYMTNGSHGCVNSPYNLAQAIYNNIDIGTPIVCYY